MTPLIELTDDEIRALKVQRETTHKSRLRGRCDMVLMAHEGLSPAQIAERLGVGQATVSRYLHRYRAEGVAGLGDRPRAGRPRRVTPEYEETLLHVVAQPPAALDLPFAHWTTARLAGYMAEQTGIVITPRQVENYLKMNGVRLRRPTGRAG